MIWAALAFLGIPIWLVVGGLIGTMVSRHHFRAQPGVVPLMIRSAGDDQWPRGLAYGRYVHNVLIVNHGLAQVRTSVHVVEHVESLDLGDKTFKHIDDPVAFTPLLRSPCTRLLYARPGWSTCPSDSSNARPRATRLLP